MKKRIKLALWGIVLLGLVGYGIFAITRPLTAELIRVAPRTIAKTFSEEGVVVPAAEKKLYSLLGGKVAAVNVEEGQQVVKGALLIQMDTTEIAYQLTQVKGQLASVQGQEQQAYRQPYASQISQQRLAIEQAKVQVAAAQKEFDRVKALFQVGAVSEETYDQAERTVQAAENLLAQQERALELITEQSDPPQGTAEQFAGLKQSLAAQIALLTYQESQGRIFAPMDGQVMAAFVKSQDVVTPGTLLLTVFQPGKYHLEAFLLGEDAAHVQPGMRVKAVLEDSAADLPFDGVVAQIAPGAMEKVSALGLVERRVKVTIDLEGNVDRLRPGYNLDVRFTTRQEKDKLAVPKTVVFPGEKGDALWVVRDGRAVIQPVKQGLDTDRDVVIEEGLQPGDLVIGNPQLPGLREGKKVIAP